MAFEDIDRRRFLLMGLLTVITVPTVYFVSQRDQDDPPDPGAVTEAEAAVSIEDEPNRPELELTDEEPSFLDGPVEEANPGVNEIAIPPQPDGASLRLTASYRGNVPGVGTCLLSEIGPGATVTIKNVDNGRAVSCVTAQAPESQVADVVLHTDAFIRLADPTEAPIAIELTQ